MPKADGERVLRDILALTALPATWVGHDASFLARALCDGLGAVLQAPAIVVRARTGRSEPVLATSFSAGPGIEQALDDLVSASAYLPPTDPFPLGGGFTAYGSPLGPVAEYGTILAASQSPDFPTMEDRLLLGLAAIQAATSLRSQQLTYELAAARKELALREKQAALGQLVSGVAHEIRTPLTYIANNLEVLRIRLARGDSAQAAEAVQRSLEGVERIRSLVGQLRQLGREAPSARAEHELDPIVRDCVRLFEATHPGAARVATDLASPAKLLLDPLLIQQAVLNLLENGFEAAGGRGTLRIRTRTDSLGAWLEVEDDGPGVPPDVRERIFDPFFTTKPTGLGLGLSIVRRIVETHHGAVEVESGGRGGARFRLRFPLPPRRLVPASVPRRDVEDVLGSQPA